MPVVADENEYDVAGSGRSYACEKKMFADWCARHALTLSFFQLHRRCIFSPRPYTRRIAGTPIYSFDCRSPSRARWALLDRAGCRSPTSIRLQQQQNSVLALYRPIRPRNWLDISLVRQSRNKVQVLPRERPTRRTTPYERAN